MSRTLFSGVAALALLVLAGAGCSAPTQTPAEEQTQPAPAMMEEEHDTTMEEGTMMEKDDAMMEEGAMMNDEEDAAMESNTEAMMEVNLDTAVDGDTMMETAGSYSDYSAEALSRAQAGRTVLFFHASWCPTCRSLDKNITAAQDEIPSGVHILKVDYDAQTALRQQYGVTVQHTLVEVDRNGALVSKWTGGKNLDAILSRL